MPEKLNHHERLQALIEGVGLDRPPVAMWRHFHLEENDRDRIVEATVGWQKRFDWDFLKISPKASYHYEPWGVKMKHSPDGIATPKRIGWPIAEPDDWSRIMPLPVSHPEFQDQLYAISRIRRALPRPFRIVMTVFNPLSVAGDMVPKDQMLIDHLRQAPDKVEEALNAIAATLAALVPEMRDAGCDGIFLATTQWASADRLTVAEVRRFGLTHDRPVWAAAGDDAFNILHVCSTNCYLAEYREFPAALVNWDATDPTNPWLRDGYEILKRPVLGGIGHFTDLVNDPPALLREKTRRLIDANRDIPFAVGPGCTIPVTVAYEKLDAIRSTVEAARQ
ncbi:MAG TPA: uroporphyrinogen decarboxylase family protein [Acidobacteriota bacterium]|nr:uroporphyrinogen decarboxylase family protein [Acidobacteriota bacterium]